MSGSQIMVILIVLIAVIGSVIKSKQYDDRKSRKVRTDPESARLRSEVQELKDRIQVLERVVTDTHGQVGLDREIERLRDR